MGKTVLVITLLATFSLAAVAQESNISLNALDNPQAVSAQPGRMQAPDTISSTLPFCPAQTCLYYAGDFDSANSNANGLFNGQDTGAGLWNQVWVGVKPSSAAIITGATFNQFFTAGFVGTNPTPFATAVGLSGLDGGTLVCNTTGNATLKQYGESDFGLVQYSYTIKKLAKPCGIAKPTKQVPSTYVSLLPISANGYGYVTNVEDAKPKNHRGWKNDLDDCYMENNIPHNPPQVWYTCSSQGIFDEFSIALTGREAK